MSEFEHDWSNPGDESDYKQLPLTNDAVVEIDMDEEQVAVSMRVLAQASKLPDALVNHAEGVIFGNGIPPRYMASRWVGEPDGEKRDWYTDALKGKPGY